MIFIKRVTFLIIVKKNQIYLKYLLFKEVKNSNEGYYFIFDNVFHIIVKSKRLKEK